MNTYHIRLRSRRLYEKRVELSMLSVFISKVRLVNSNYLHETTLKAEEIVHVNLLSLLIQLAFFCKTQLSRLM